MSDARFDLIFEGMLKPDADPEQVRQRLGAMFKLDAAGIERLFLGRPVVISRGVDVASAARYKRAFDEAGAILTLSLVETRTGPSAGSDPRPPTAPTAGDASSSAAGEPDGALSLAPMDGFLEEPPEVKMLDIDTSYLSLVPGPEWSLGDCDPDPPEVRLPDTSHLKLADMDEQPDDQNGPD